MFSYVILLFFEWSTVSPSNSCSFLKCILWTHAINSKVFIIAHSKYYQLVMIFCFYWHPQISFPTFLFKIKGIRNVFKYNLLLTSSEDLNRNYYLFQIFHAILIEKFQGDLRWCTYYWPQSNGSTISMLEKCKKIKELKRTHIESFV